MTNHNGVKRNTVQWTAESGPDYEARQKPYQIMVRFSRWQALWENGKPYINSFAQYRDMYRCELDNGEVHFNRRGWAYRDATKAERKQLRRTAVRILDDDGWTQAPPLWLALRQAIIALRYNKTELKRTNSYSFGTLYRKGLRHQWLNFKTIEGIVDGTLEQRYKEKGQINYPIQGKYGLISNI